MSTTDAKVLVEEAVATDIDVEKEMLEGVAEEKVEGGFKIVVRKLRYTTTYEIPNTEKGGS